MIISSVVKNGKETGDHVLVISRDECQTINTVFTKFCEENKRQKKAKKMLKEFDDNLQIW